MDKIKTLTTILEAFPITHLTFTFSNHPISTLINFFNSILKFYYCLSLLYLLSTRQNPQKIGTEVQFLKTWSLKIGLVFCRKHVKYMHYCQFADPMLILEWDFESHIKDIQYCLGTTSGGIESKIMIFSSPTHWKQITDI